MYTSLLTKLSFVDEKLEVAMREAAEWIENMDDSYAIDDVLIYSGCEDSFWSVNILLLGAMDSVR